jgi:hypothetical protein
MKKFIGIICLMVLFTCGFGQTYYFTSFGWSNDDLHLYYATDTSYNWKHIVSSYGTNHITPYHFGDAYSTKISDTNVCFMVAPHRWHYNGCCNSGTMFGGNSNPYKNIYANSSSSCSPNSSYYEKPKGVLNIPYYDIKITNNSPKYREVIGISEKTFYNCDSLTKITIPSTIKTIGDNFIYGCNMLDTIVFENTFNEDTIYPPTMEDYTWFITKPITIVVPCNSYDTFYNYIHSLGTPQMVQLNIVPDNICDCGAYVIDTIQVYDTTQVIDTIYTTETIYDTIQVTDTIFNTINVYDTIVTNIMNVHHIYDTTFVNDTITHTQYFMYYDTMSVVVYDTLSVLVYDTMSVIVNDTNSILIYDTITETITYIYEVYDTNFVTLYDTIVINVYDTIYETIYDTILVFKQVNETFDDLRLYPIPTKDYVNVDYSGGHLEYQLYNNRGKYLESGEITLHDVVDLTKYASGEYYFKAKLDNGEVITKKIIKMSF